MTMTPLPVLYATTESQSKRIVERLAVYASYRAAAANPPSPAAAKSPARAAQETPARAARAAARRLPPRLARS